MINDYHGVQIHWLISICYKSIIVYVQTSTRFIFFTPFPHILWFYHILHLYAYHFTVYYSSTLATSCEELTHWKRLWWWEGLGVGGEGDDRGWDGWMASLTRWTWVWVNPGSWWWTGRPGVLRFMGLQRVGHDWVTDLIW